MVNYYHVLGLNENATPEEIKSAFKKLAVKYHPDKHPGRPEMEEKFKEINEAHQVLSDPYEKARFDLKLKYQQFSSSQSRPHHYPGRAGRYARPNPRYYRTKVDHKRNAIATAYAFGITFLIAILVMSGVWAKKSYDNHQKEARFAERRATFEIAKDQFDRGEYKEAFEIMSSMKYFDIREEKDMREFKETMVDEIINIGDAAFQRAEFLDAIAHYEMAIEFQPKRSFNDQKKKLAEAYRQIGDTEKAMEILNTFLVNEYEIIASLVKIAEIHRDQNNDLEEALDHYLIAHRLAIKRYKAFFGEAYPLVINEEYVPKSHFYLYSGLADIYLKLNDTEMAIKAADWNKYVWPDSTAAYITTAEAYIKLNNPSKACQEYDQAALRGWSGELPITCN